MKKQEWNLIFWGGVEEFDTSLSKCGTSLAESDTSLAKCGTSPANSGTNINLEECGTSLAECDTNTSPAGCGTNSSLAECDTNIGTTQINQSIRLVKLYWSPPFQTSSMRYEFWLLLWQQLVWFGFCFEICLQYFCFGVGIDGFFLLFLMWGFSTIHVHLH